MDKISMCNKYCLDIFFILLDMSKAYEYVMLYAI
jgi:hypothetical protein